VKNGWFLPVFIRRKRISWNGGPGLGLLVFIQGKSISWNGGPGGTPFQLILFPRINTGKNQPLFTRTSPPVEDGTNTMFRNVGF
jgi:hypothetical protein